MNKYEALFIFPPDEGPDATKSDETRLEETLTRFGGRIVDRQDWGKRPLGFALRKFREGRILHWNFEIDAPKLIDLRRQLQLNEKILKSSIFRAVTPKPPKEKANKKKRPPQEKPLHERAPHARQS